MNAFDIALLVLGAVLVTLGMLKGLVRILFAVGALIAAFILAARFHTQLAQLFRGGEVTSGWAPLMSYATIFVGVLLVGGVAGFLARKLLKAALLGWADRLAGAALGLAAALLAAALVILPVVAYLPFGEWILADSLLAPYVTVVSDVANGLVPDSLATSYRERMENLRRQWRERYLGEQAPTSPS